MINRYDWQRMTGQLKHLLIALSFSIIPQYAISGEEPIEHALPEFEAQYAVQKLGIKLAEAVYRLLYTDSGYQFTQNTTLYGAATLLGDDTVSAVSYVDQVRGNLLLKQHTYTQTGREKNKDEDIEIKWQTYKNTLKGDITGIVRSKPIALKTNSEIWDVLSFQIPLMIEADITTREYPYQAILKGEIDTYNFVLTESKKVTYADREYTALHLVRTDPKRDRQLHIWLIPELHNIPVIVENIRDGKQHSRMQLESVRFDLEQPLTDDLQKDDLDNVDEY